MDKLFYKITGGKGILSICKFSFDREQTTYFGIIDSLKKEFVSFLKLKRIITAALLTALFCLTVSGSEYYVSKNGDNSDGKSWNTAWNEMDQIQWSLVSPGDTIYLDGGKTEMVYTTTMTIKKSGTQGSPICILLSRETDRNGQATIFGGVTQPPYDDQPTYSGEMPTLDAGISIGAYSWITIDGTKWSGITIHGTGGDGVELGEHTSDTSKKAHDIVVRNVKIYDIGTPEKVDNSVQAKFPQLTIGHWHTMANASGIMFSYMAGARNILLERLIISNTSDEAVGEGPCWNLTLRQTWLDNGRTAPNGKPFNYMNHPDGYQNYTWGGNQGPWLIEDCVIGPHFMQGLFPGSSDDDPKYSNSTYVNDITVRNVLFMDNLSSNIFGVAGSNWTFDHITSYIVPQGGNNFTSQQANTNDVVTNSILYGGNIANENKVDFENNIYYNTDGEKLSHSDSSNKHMDPQFVDIAGYDFALSPGSPAIGKGSRVTSVAKLFSLFPGNGPGFFQFSANIFNKDSKATTITITVQRLGASDGAVTVDYVSADSSAIAGKNYISSTGTLSWADGDHEDKTFTVSILKASSGNPLIAKILLRNPTGGAVIESPGQALLLLSDATDINYPAPPFLLQNSPNPFINTTTFKFGVPAKSFVTLKVYDLSGRLIASVISKEYDAGLYSEDWTASNVVKGIYVCKLLIGSSSFYKKIVVLKLK